MFLVIISIVLGFLGLVLGASLGDGFFATIFCFVGILSPALFALEKIYKNSVYGREQNSKVDDEVLESLRVSGILEDSEYEKACARLSEMNELSENKMKYSVGVDILFKLSQEGIISENEFDEKIKRLKILYEQ
jgi:hypothetical protein